MKVASIRLQNFKRFTDLQIVDIPESVKLVVLVGPNGCGKSSVLDGFIRWHRYNTGLGYLSDPEYFEKDRQQGSVEEGSVEVSLYGGQNATKDSLYVRTAYRNDADFSSSEITAQPSPIDNPRLHRSIEDDKTVSQNYQRLLLDSITSLYDQNNKTKEAQEICDELIGRIRTSMLNIFGDLSLNGIEEALGSGDGAGAFYFKKGNVTSYHYKNLSGGEKAAFDLILDMHIKSKYFPNAIYCIDEIEAHLHTKIQGTILREFARIVPDDSQLWVTTHSLGTLRAAQEIEAGKPGSVCVIDFDGVALDSETVLRPTTLDSVAWRKLLSIALDDLTELIVPEVLVICEGSLDSERNPVWDERVYRQIFCDKRPLVEFKSCGSKSDLERAATIASGISPGTHVLKLRDRDDLTPEHRTRLLEDDPNLRVLKRRSLESYLLDDEVLEALVSDRGTNEENAIDKLKQARNAAISRNGSAKGAVGPVYDAAKEVLGNTDGLGENRFQFSADVLAKLITQEMSIRQEIEAILDLP